VRRGAGTVTSTFQYREYGAKAVAAGRCFGATLHQSRKRRVDRAAGRQFCEHATRHVQIGLALTCQPPFFVEFDREREFGGDRFNPHKWQSPVLSACTRENYAA
jgi:hypothetical protein